MPICSYLAVPVAGEADSLSERLGVLPGCEVIRSTNRDVLVLVTETAGIAEEGALRSELEATEGLAALVLTFGEVDPEAEGVAAPASSRDARQAPPPLLDPRNTRALLDAREAGRTGDPS